VHQVGDQTRVLFSRFIALESYVALYERDMYLWLGFG